MRAYFVLIGVLVLLHSSKAQIITDADSVPLNHIQVLGSHNSYLPAHSFATAPWAQ